MSLWMLIVTLGLVKLVLGVLLLWVPFRSDHALDALDTAAPGASASEDDGGSRTLPGGPLEPHPRPHAPRHRRSRRGPHGSSSPAPSPPARVRRPAVRVTTHR